MIFHRLGLIHKNQRGFTLIELLVALAITGLITGAITTTIFQVVNGNARTNNHMTAVRQVQNAGYWVSHDGQMAQLEPDIVKNGEGRLESITLTWTDWDGTVHQVTYTLENMIGGPKQLKRSHSVNGGEPSETIVARYIVPGVPKTNVEFTDGVLTFTVTAKVGTGSQEQSETRTYEIIPRPSI